MSAFVLFPLALIGLLLSARKDRARTRQALGAAWRSWVGLLPSLLGLTAGIGLITALVSPQAVARLFQEHGAAGFLLLSGVGALLTIPSPVAYPLAGTLHRMGASLPALASFITTLTMVGLLTAPLEVKAFGRAFTVRRQALSLVLALAIGAAMGVLL